MIHPYKLCKSVVCIYDNKWVLLDGKTQVPRTRTLCTVDVRYGISVNTPTNPYLQVDTFPKAYQASSITPVCQSTGSKPDQILTMHHCLVGRYKRAEKAHASFHQPKHMPHPASVLSVLYGQNLDLCLFLPYQLLNGGEKPQRSCTTYSWSSRLMISHWRQLSAGKAGNRAHNKTSQPTYCLKESFVKLWVAISPIDGICNDVR